MKMNLIRTLEGWVHFPPNSSTFHDMFIFYPYILTYSDMSLYKIDNH